MYQVGNSEFKSNIIQVAARKLLCSSDTKISDNQEEQVAQILACLSVRLSLEFKQVQHVESKGGFARVDLSLSTSAHPQKLARDRASRRISALFRDSLRPWDGPRLGRGARAHRAHLSTGEREPRFQPQASAATVDSPQNAVELCHKRVSMTF